MGWDGSFLYNGYKLTKDWFDMDIEEQRVIMACSFYVKNESTIRETAKIFEYCYITLWRRMHNKCAELSPELYEDVKKQIKINVERSRINAR